MDIMQVQMFGCDKYPSNVYEGGHNVSMSIDRYAVGIYGTFHKPFCDHPQAQPIAAPLVFIPFVIICAYIVLSLTVAAVTAGITDRKSVV